MRPRLLGILVACGACWGEAQALAEPPARVLGCCAPADLLCAMRLAPLRRPRPAERSPIQRAEDLTVRSAERFVAQLGALLRLRRS